MTVRGCAAATASLVSAVWGCGTASEEIATVKTVSPAMAYNNTATTVQIAGGPFRPAYRFDTTAGATSANAGGFSVTLTSVPTPASATPISVQVDEVSWLTIATLDATLPAAVPAGVYDVTVTDPRGRSALRPEGFTSLGPDEQAPIVTIETPKPGSIIGAETVVSVSFVADDGAGRLEVLEATVTREGISAEMPCAPTGDLSRARCDFQFDAPAPTGDSDTIVIDARARDSAGNWSKQPPVPYRLARRPTLTGLSPSPAVGPASGGTSIEVSGVDFVEPADGSEGTQLLIDGRPVPTQMVVSPTQIRATTPSHDSGIATVTVSTGGAESLQMYYFQFVDGPIVRTVAPTSGPVSGGTWIKVAGNNFREPQTVIKIGGFALRCPYFDGPNRIVGRTPPGAVGSVTITATDDEIDATYTWPLGAFTYEEAAADPPDGGVDPTDCSGRP